MCEFHFWLAISNFKMNKLILIKLFFLEIN